MKTLTPAHAAIILLVGLGGAFPALATDTDPQELGEAANAIHGFKFDCPPEAISAKANVADIAPNAPALMRVKLVKDHGVAVAQDVTEGGAPSLNAELPKGPGAYLALFYKTAAGEENYIGSVVCKTSGADHHPVLTKIP